MSRLMPSRVVAVAVLFGLSLLVVAQDKAPSEKEAIDKKIMAEIKDSNLSTEHQKPGDAKRPQDTLDRDRPKPAREDPVDPPPQGRR